MAEPTVQVPVSLIERIDSAYNASSDTLAALIEQLWMLSQPTPTAERDVCAASGSFTGDTCFEDAGHRGRHVSVRGISWEPTDAPPSIADMEPGTRCREEVSGTVPSWAGEDQISPCLCVLDAGHDGRHKCDHQVDPSTIRDVQPPKET